MTHTNNKRRKHSPEFKAAVVLELLTGKVSVAQQARRRQLKESMLYEWRREAVEKLPLVFVQRTPEETVNQRVEELERLIGEQAVEIAALKKPRSGSAGRRGQARNRERAGP